MKYQVTLLIFLLLSISLFAELKQVDVIQKDAEKSLLHHLNTTIQLLLYTPENTLFSEEGKCYINEQAVIQKEGKDCIQLKNGGFLDLPQRLKENDLEGVIEIIGAHLEALNQKRSL